MLDDALQCTADVDAAVKTPVLLVHGTWSNTEESFSWGYQRVLPQLGYPTCTVGLPGRALVDHQRSVEYVVHAIRRVAERSGRSIFVLGHSQGSVLAIHALRFWPDLAAKVEDFVGLAGLYRGTQLADTLCRFVCPPANWQQRRDSLYTAAINLRPDPPGPSYTSIYTQFDTVASPSTETAPLEGASNILIQDLCPLRPVDHVGMLGDAVTFRLVIDALTNPGPADPTRAPVNCTEIYMPGADVAAIPGAVASFLAAVAATPLDPNNTPQEPPLRCYLDPACAANSAADAANGAGGATPKARCAGRPATLIGTPGRNRLTGTARADVILGLGGKDTIRGLGGSDIVCGGRGKDLLNGGRGRDILLGQAGRDSLRGGPARDICTGGKSPDSANSCEIERTI
jgi:pimeloyl-ACP methyl ester carboxylesterase